jgi:hypothetical protein
MRFQWLMTVTLALVGCGARGVLDSGTSEGGATAPEPAQMGSACGPTDGAAIEIGVGWTTCTPSPSTPGLVFLISGADLAGLHDGSILTVTPNLSGSTQGAHFNGTAAVDLTSGTLEFTTYIPGASATGTYDVTWPGGAGSGSFEVIAICPGGGHCG